MSHFNPIIPPNSPLQRRQPASNSKLVVSVFLILAVHAFILAGLLIQGCKRQETTSTGDFPELQEHSLTRTPQSQSPSLDNNSPSPAPEPAAPSETYATTPAPRQDPVPPPLNPPEPTLSPAPGAGAVKNRPESPVLTPPAAEPGLNPQLYSGPTSVYVVKRGDSLTKVARAHGTTVRALRALNSLTTDRILVGQKLKVPSGAPQAGNSNAEPAASDVPALGSPR